MYRNDKIKPILERLLDGREDAAEIIESLQEIDETEVDTTELVDAARAEGRAAADKEWNQRYLAAFFGESPATVDVIEQTEEMSEPEGEDTPVNYTDLFSEEEM